MNLTELYSRIQDWENIHTEFKEKIINHDDLAAAIVAFANTDGGQIIFGVDSDKQIVGIDDTDQLMQFIDNVAYNNCEPPITIIQETTRNLTGQVVVTVNIPKGDQRPYRTNRGVYYVRTTSGRRQASREELLRLFQSVESLFYDEIYVMRATPDDLDEQAIKALFDNIQAQGIDIAGITKDRLLQNWHLVQEVNGNIHPTLAGILFLSRNPEFFFPYVYISALRIPGTDISSEPIDQKHINGCLTDMLDDTMRFLNIHLMRPHKIKGLEPEAKPELPVAALREVLVNAMAHRDYTIPAPIRVIIFDDRIEIHTPGQLPNTVTVESIKQGVHVLRNPTIYNIFLKIGLVTDAGSGVPRMIRLIRKSTGQEPAFHLSEGEFTVIFFRPSIESLIS